MYSIISFRRITIYVLIYCFGLPYIVSAFPTPKQVSIVSQAPDSLRQQVAFKSGYFLYPAPKSEKDCFYQGIMDGRRVAYKLKLDKKAKTGEGAAVAATMLHGSMGAMMSYGVAASSKHLPPDFILRDLNDLSVEYQQGFLQGYETQMREFSKAAAADGWLIGSLLVALTGLLVVVYTAQHTPSSSRY